MSELLLGNPSFSIHVGDYITKRDNSNLPYYYFKNGPLKVSKIEYDKKYGREVVFALVGEKEFGFNADLVMYAYRPK